MKKILSCIAFLAFFSLAASSVFAGPSDPGGSLAQEAEAPALPQNPVNLWVADSLGTLQPGQKEKVAIHFEVAKDSYVNREMLSVTAEPVDGLVLGEAIFPPHETKEVASLGKIAEIYKHNFDLELPFSIAENATPGSLELNLKVRYQACNEVVCFVPKTSKFKVALTITSAKGLMPITAPVVIQPDTPQYGSEFERELEQKGWLWAYLFAFLGGVLASFTPCVYPMIPITMAVIGARKAKSRRESFQLSVVFVLGIACVYSLLGVTAAATGNVFGGIMQNSYVVGFIALLFGAMALSMMGFYDLELPPSMQTRLNQMGGKGYLGSFIVGMVTGVVASPCVGPVLVSMLGWVATAAANPAYSKAASLSLGFSLLFVFAQGLGLLFLVIGTFTGVLVNLPKSGGWMIRVKHALGVMMFGVAWFYAVPLLPVWVPVLALAGGLFFLSTSELEAAKERKLSTAFMSAGAGYLGLLGLNGIMPGSVTTGWLPASHVQAAHLESVAWLPSEKEGLKQAKQSQKPIMIDFYADWCIACKELDLYTYSDAEVSRKLEGFVSVKIDGTDDAKPEIQELYKKYSVLGLPTVLFLTPDGKVIPGLTLTGFEGPEPFLQRLEKVSSLLKPSQS